MTAYACRLVLLTCVLGAAAGCSTLERTRGNWWELSREPSGQAPDPSTTPEAVVQVYAARTVGWRGLLAVHTWIAVKPSGAPSYTRYEVMGWGVSRGAAALRVNRTGPDNHWFGSRPEQQHLHRLRGTRGARAAAQPAVHGHWQGLPGGRRASGPRAERHRWAGVALGFAGDYNRLG